MLPLRYINYFFIGFSILWAPFQLGFFPYDGQGRLKVIVSLLVIFMNLVHSNKFKSTFKHKAVIYWSLWIVYASFNLYFSGYHNDKSPFLYFIWLHLFFPLLGMIVSIIEIKRNDIKFISFLTKIFIIYGLASITILSGSNDDRALGELGNMGPLITIFLIFFVSILFTKRKIKLAYLIPILLFSLYIPIIGGTRKALGAAVVMIIALVISKIRFNMKNFIYLGVIVLILNIGYDYIMESTIIGERIEKGNEVGADKNTTDIPLLSFLGDRVIFYINGWDIFINNIWTGIGLRNYFHTTHSTHVLHTEYMVQLTEGGIIGSFLFVLFNGWIGKSLLSLYRKLKYNRSLIIILMGAFAAILFINFTAWTYDFIHYFIVFGIIIGYIYKFKYTRRFSDENTIR